MTRYLFQRTGLFFSCPPTHFGCGPRSTAAVCHSDRPHLMHWPAGPINSDDCTDQVPRFVHKVAPHLREHDDRGQFLTGLDTFLTGIGARLFGTPGRWIPTALSDKSVR
jgi:hypothetical protein